MLASAVVETVNCHTRFPLFYSWPCFPRTISFSKPCVMINNGTTVENKREEKQSLSIIMNMLLPAAYFTRLLCFMFVHPYTRHTAPSTCLWLPFLVHFHHLRVCLCVTSWSLWHSKAAHLFSWIMLLLLPNGSFAQISQSNWMIFKKNTQCVAIHCGYQSLFLHYFCLV